jgi:hypothetical protein
MTDTRTCTSCHVEKPNTNDHFRRYRRYDRCGEKVHTLAKCRECERIIARTRWNTKQAALECAADHRPSELTWTRTSYGLNTEVSRWLSRNVRASASI